MNEPSPKRAVEQSPERNPWVPRRKLEFSPEGAEQTASPFQGYPDGPIIPGLAHWALLQGPSRARLGETPWDAKVLDRNYAVLSGQRPLKPPALPEVDGLKGE